MACSKYSQTPFIITGTGDQKKVNRVSMLKWDKIRENVGALFYQGQKATFL